MKTYDRPPRGKELLIWIFILIFLLICIITSAQDNKIDLHLTPIEKTISTSMLSLPIAYHMLTPGCSTIDRITVGTCAVLIVLVNVDLGNRVSVNASGINYKLRNKTFGCYIPPYKKKSLKQLKIK